MYLPVRAPWRRLRAAGRTVADAAHRREQCDRQTTRSEERCGSSRCAGRPDRSRRCWVRGTQGGSRSAQLRGTPLPPPSGAQSARAIISSTRRRRADVSALSSSCAWGFNRSHAQKNSSQVGRCDAPGFTAPTSTSIGDTRADQRRGHAAWRQTSPRAWVQSSAQAREPLASRASEGREPPRCRSRPSSGPCTTRVASARAHIRTRPSGSCGFHPGRTTCADSRPSGGSMTP